MRSPSSLCICKPPPHQLLNAWTNLFETRYVRVGIYHGTWAHLNGILHKSLPSVCVSVYVSLLLLQGNGSVKCIRLIGAMQRLGKHIPEATNTYNNRRIIGLVIFYVVSLLWNETLWVCLCILLSLLGNNSIKTFPRQRRIVGGVVYFAVSVVSKESRRLVLPKTACYILSRF
jgi:hypothetical protein